MPTSLVSGFSNKQVNNLMIMMSAMMDAKLEAYFGRLDQTRQQSNPIPAIQYSNQQSPPVQPKKKKRNEKTRLQYKRRKAYTSQNRVEKKPRKHVVLERTKLIPWDGSHTSLQPALQRFDCCWYAVIRWDGTMVRHGTSGMPRIGIG